MTRDVVEASFDGMWIVVLCAVLFAGFLVGYLVGHAHGYELARQRSRGSVSKAEPLAGSKPPATPVQNKAIQATIDEVERTEHRRTRSNEKREPLP